MFVYVAQWRAGRWTPRRDFSGSSREKPEIEGWMRVDRDKEADSEYCTFPENTEPAATGQGVVSADFSTPTGERPSRARRGSPK